MIIPADFADLMGIRPLPCGRWGYVCCRLFCRELCTRTDDHQSGEHRCMEHLELS